MEKWERVRKMCSLLAGGALILLVFTVTAKWGSIFQRGNPIPYLAAACRLSEPGSYEAVGDRTDLYITRREEREGLFQMIEDTYGLECTDRLGSSYVFSDGESCFLVDSEIYWGRFTVWMLSFADAFPAENSD